MGRTMMTFIPAVLILVPPMLIIEGILVGTETQPWGVRAVLIVWLYLTIGGMYAFFQVRGFRRQVRTHGGKIRQMLRHDS